MFLNVTSPGSAADWLQGVFCLPVGSMTVSQTLYVVMLSGREALDLCFLCTGRFSQVTYPCAWSSRPTWPLTILVSCSVKAHSEGPVWHLDFIIGSFEEILVQAAETKSTRRTETIQKTFVCQIYDMHQWWYINMYVYKYIWHIWKMSISLAALHLEALRLPMNGVPPFVKLQAVWKPQSFLQVPRTRSRDWLSEAHPGMSKLEWFVWESRRASFLLDLQVSIRLSLFGAYAFHSCQVRCTTAPLSIQANQFQIIKFFEKNEISCQF